MMLGLDIANAYLFASVIVTAFCAMYSFAKKRSTIHILFAFLCLCIMLYTFGYLMEINVIEIERMLFWNQIQYLGIPFFPSFWVLFSIEFTNHKLKKSLWVRIAVFIIPVITFIVRLTDKYHHLFYSDIHKESFYGFSILALSKGPFYLLHTFFVTICVIFSAYLLYQHARNASKQDKFNYFLIILITFIPYTGVVGNLFNIGNTFLDYSAFIIPIISLILFSIIFSNEFLKLKSFARDKTFDNSNDGIILLNNKYLILDYNNSAKAIFPLLSEEFIDEPFSKLFENNNNNYINNKNNYYFNFNNNNIRDYFESKTKYQMDISIDGIPMHFYLTTTEILSNKKILLGYSVTLTDITTIVQASNKYTNLAMKLDEEKNLLKTTLLSVGDGVISTDLDANIVLMNPIAERLTGWTQKEAFGHNIDEIQHLMNDFTKNIEINPAHKVLELGCAYEADEDYTIMISRNKKKIPVEESAAPIRNDDGTIMGAVIVFRDFTEKKKRKEMVKFLSYHDQLTGIYNRHYFEDKIDEFNKEEYIPVSLIMADVNGLKLANDAFGHAIGDLLLKTITQIIQKHCRPDDVFSRVGGDEFVVLLPQTTESQVDAMVRKIRSEIKNMFINDLEVSISFGWDTKNQKDKYMKDVYKKAEDYMYQHKLNESPIMRERTIKRIIQSLHDKFPQEKEHAMNVGLLCEKAGQCLDFSFIQIKELQLAGTLHDIGKIAIDYHVIDHQGILSEADWIETKRHAELGYRILSSVNEMVPIAEIVLAHHENWDGTGYPKGLKGGQIPIQSRLIRIADSYDAMVSDRIYRKSIGTEAAKNELLKNSGTYFDPELVKIFVEQIAN